MWFFKIFPLDLSFASAQESIYLDFSFRHSKIKLIQLMLVSEGSILDYPIITEKVLQNTV